MARHRTSQTETVQDIETSWLQWSTNGNCQDRDGVRIFQNTMYIYLHH